MRIGFIAFMVWVMTAFAGEVEVCMTAPTNTVYFDEEDYPFSIAITNGTQRTYRMFAGGFSAFRNQLFFELDDDDETERFTAMGVLPKRDEVSLKYLGTSVRVDVMTLPPGGSLVWEIGRAHV